MNDEASLSPAPKTRSSTGLLNSRRNKMFDVKAVVALSISCLVFLMVFLSYLYFYLPVNSKRASLVADHTRLKANIEKLDKIVHQEQNSKQTVDEITSSLNNFESVSLVRQDQGRVELYGDLNRLILKNGLRNTSGPSYVPLEPVGKKATPGTSVNTKWQSVYPGIGILVTVEGPYQGLRHFVQDLERTKQFVIINEVELQRAENSSQISDSESGTRVSLVSLQLNMTMYFQREGPENVSQE